MSNFIVLLSKLRRSSKVSTLRRRRTTRSVLIPRLLSLSRMLRNVLRLSRTCKPNSERKSKRNNKRMSSLKPKLVNSNTTLSNVCRLKVSNLILPQMQSPTHVEEQRTLLINASF